MLFGSFLGSRIMAVSFLISIMSLMTHNIFKNSLKLKEENIGEFRYIFSNFNYWNDRHIVLQNAQLFKTIQPPKDSGGHA